MSVCHTFFLGNIIRVGQSHTNILLLHTVCIQYFFAGTSLNIRSDTAYLCNSG